METRVAEERWRAGVVKNKLSLALGSASIMGAGQVEPSAGEFRFIVQNIVSPLN